MGQYQNNFDIIQIVLNSNFLFLVDQNGILIILNTDKIQEIKRINLKFTFDQDNSTSTSILYEQFYAVGLVNGKLLIWDISQENQQQQFFYQFQLPKQQPIKQIQFSKNACVVGCLCGSFIWFINFKSSNSQIFRSTYFANINFLFCQNSHFILRFDFESELFQSHLYDCINSDCFSEDDEIGFRKFSKDSYYLAYHNNLKELKLYNIKEKCVIKIFNKKKSHVLDIKFSNQNKRLIIIDRKKQEKFIDLWTIENSNNLLQNEIPAEINRNISSCEISNDEDYIMIATQYLKLYYLSIEKQELIFYIDDFANLISSIAFSPNQNEFALGFTDGSVVLYDFNLQLLVQGNNLEGELVEKQYDQKPICTKIFSRQPQLLSYGCKLNDKTKIENKDGQSLVQILITKQAEMIKNEA